MRELNPRNRFKQAKGMRDLRKLFIIVVEGQTGRRYFNNFRSLPANVRVRISRGKSIVKIGLCCGQIAALMELLKTV